MPKRKQVKVLSSPMWSYLSTRVASPASLTLTVTLLDTTQEEAPRKVLFQKSYRVTEPMVARTPKGLAEAMSRAMELTSAQIITDVYAAARQRLQAKQ